uniref:Uncharacterized protein n=1 Tax=Vespula pensylvanica TaxID=30213 RepID=A0A834KTY3_VESPE|nr:hypothetical protein H0235_012658 [Vespula pensylvanica]
MDLILDINSWLYPMELDGTCDSATNFYFPCRMRFRESVMSASTMNAKRNVCQEQLPAALHLEVPRYAAAAATAAAAAAQSPSFPPIETVGTGSVSRPRLHGRDPGSIPYSLWRKFRACSPSRNDDDDDDDDNKDEEK